eukprot:SAG22_NODE_2247_length_2793_cov_2.069414_2_plen_40_part_00
MARWPTALSLLSLLRLSVRLGLLHLGVVAILHPLRTKTT